MSKVLGYIKKYDILIFVILGFLLYYPSLSYDILSYDDLPYIVNNEYLNGRIPFNFFNFFVPNLICKDIYTPLSFVIYWLIINVFGINACVFHFVNVFFYILSSVALFYLLKKIVNNYSVIFFAVILYILHPCHIENTAWISAMGYNIASLFYYLSFIYFIIAFDDKNKLNYIFSVIFYIFAILSQPIAVTLPAILFLWVFCFRRDRLKESIKYIFAYIPFLLIYVYLYSQTILKDRFKENLNYNFIEKLSIWGFDLFNSFIPINLCVYKSFPSFYFIIIFILFLCLCYFFRKNIYFNFFLGFAIIVFLPYSNIAFSLYDPVLDRYLLLSSVSSCVLISYLSFYILDKFKNSNLLKYITFIFFIILYFVPFITYLPVWKNNRSFWFYNYNVSRNLMSISAYARIMLIDEHRYDDALILADELIKKSPQAFEGYEIKIQALMEKGYLNDSLSVALKVKELIPDNYLIYTYLFDIYIALQDYDNAQKSLDTAFVKAKKQNLYKNEIANLLLNKQMILCYVLVETDKFIEYFRIISNNFKLLQDNGEFYQILDKKNYSDRKRICFNYLKKFTEYQNSVLRLLSCLYIQETYKEDAPKVMKLLLEDMNKAEKEIKNNDYDSAEKIYLSIISKNEYMYLAYKNLGILYLNTNRQDKARDIFGKMLEINPNDEQVRQILLSLGENIKK